MTNSGLWRCAAARLDKRLQTVQVIRIALPHRFFQKMRGKGLSKVL